MQIQGNYTMQQLILLLLLVPTLLSAETYEGSDSLKPKKEYTYKAKSGSDIDPNLLNDEVPDDPRIRFATYFGGSAADAVQDFKIDSKGYLYAIGNTFSTDFPMVGNSFDSEKTEEDYIDAFIVKFDTLGFPVWSTYFGGTGEDRGIRLEIDSEDNIIIAGATNSPNFPLKGEFDQDSIKGEADMYVAKFDQDGNLLWSRLFGGTYLDQSFGLAIDDDDNIYVAGNTMSTDIVRSDWTYQPEFSLFIGKWRDFSDGVFAKFSPEGKHIWSSYLGAQRVEHLEDIDVYGDEIAIVGRLSAPITKTHENMYIIGTEDAIQQLPCDTTYYEHYTLYDPFIAKFSTDSCKLKYFTYYCAEARRANLSDNYYYFSDYDADGNFILVIDTDNNSMQVKGSPFHTYNPPGHKDGIMMLSLSPQNAVNWDWDITAGENLSDNAYTIDNQILWGEVTTDKNLFPEDSNHIANFDNGAKVSFLLMRFDLSKFTQWYSYHPHPLADSKISVRNNDIYSTAKSHSMGLLKNAYSEEFHEYGLYLINFDLRENFGYSAIDTGRNYLSNISVYPSITTESITISSEDSISQLQIYDLLGKQLYSKEIPFPLNELEINIENYADGMYFILVNNKYSLKFIKER